MLRLLISDWDAPMPKKPTNEFGVMSFSKTGSVEKITHRLPDDKQGQEAAVAQRWAEQLGERTEKKYTVKMLEENDHDFELYEDGLLKFVVQMVEVTRHDFCKQLTQEEYDSSRFTEVIYISPEERYGVDQVKSFTLITEKIRRKQEKHYAKPGVGEFVLLIWSVWYGVHFTGDDKTGRISNAENYLAENGMAPFDAVWLCDMHGTRRLQAVRNEGSGLRAEEITGKRRVSIFIPAIKMTPTSSGTT